MLVFRHAARGEERGKQTSRESQVWRETACGWVSVRGRKAKTAEETRLDFTDEEGQVVQLGWQAPSPPDLHQGPSAPLPWGKAQGMDGLRRSSLRAARDLALALPDLGPWLSSRAGAQPRVRTKGWRTKKGNSETYSKNGAQKRLPKKSKANHWHFLTSSPNLGLRCPRV